MTLFAIEDAALADTLPISRSAAMRWGTDRGSFAARSKAGRAGFIHLVNSIRTFVGTVSEAHALSFPARVIDQSPLQFVFWEKA